MVKGLAGLIGNVAWPALSVMRLGLLYR